MGYPCVALVYNLSMAKRTACRGHGWEVLGLNPDCLWPTHGVIVR